MLQVLRSALVSSDETLAAGSVVQGSGCPGNFSEAAGVGGGAPNPVVWVLAEYIPEEKQLSSVRKIAQLGLTVS